MRKNLGNDARKVLDQANNRLAKILNTGSGIKIAQRKRRSKRAKKRLLVNEEKMKDENEDASEHKKETDEKKESPADAKVEEAN